MNKTVFATFVYPGSEMHLPRMFSSLNKQSDHDFDVAIFNDGAKHLEKICEKYLIKSPKIRPVRGSIPKIRASGLTQLKNLGYANVIFGDADDSFAPNRVEVSKNLLQVSHRLSCNSRVSCYIYFQFLTFFRRMSDDLRNQEFIGKRSPFDLKLRWHILQSYF